MRKIENFVRYFIHKLTKSEAEFASGYLAFYILLSFVPLLLFLSNMVVKVVPNFHEYIFGLIENLPNDVQNIVNPILENIFNGVSSTLSIASIASAIWLGSRGFLGLIKSLNKIFDVNPKSKIPFYEKIFSVFFTIGFLVVIVLFLLLSVFNEMIFNFISSFTERFGFIDNIVDTLLNGVGSLMPLILGIVLLFLFYRFAPSFNKFNRPKYTSIIVGSIFAILGVGLMTFFYKFTNDILNNEPSIYGSLGSILVTLVWLLAICNMIIYGAVFIKTFDDVVIHNMTIFDLNPNEKLFFKKKNII